MFATPEHAKSCVKGDVVLVQDPQTGLILNRAFQPALMQYDADYQNEQAESPTFRAHLTVVSEIIKRHFNGCRLMEIGCGKGHFLEHLQEMGFEISGLDPAYEGTNISVLKKDFGPELGLRADGIILRHVLEHVQDPVGFRAHLCASTEHGLTFSTNMSTTSASATSVVFWAAFTNQVLPLPANISTSSPILRQFKSRSVKTQQILLSLQIFFTP